MGRGNEAQQVRFVSVKAERPYHPSRARGGGSGGSASQREAPPWQRQCRCDSIRLPDFVALGLRGGGSGGRGPPRRRRRDSIRPPPLRRARPKKDEPTDTHSLTFVQMHKRNQTTQKGQPAERSLQTNGLSVAKTWRKTLNRNNPATFFCLGCERSTYSRKSVEKFSPNVVSFGTDDNAFFLEIRIPAQKKENNRKTTVPEIQRNRQMILLGLDTFCISTCSPGWYLCCNIFVLSPETKKTKLKEWNEWLSSW